MKLSILIPTYNQDCTRLVQSLLLQLPPDGEIIVGDDGSTDTSVKQANRVIASWEHCRLWEAPHNLGRSAIRNRLVQFAQNPRILFMDSDAKVITTDYIERYTQEFQGGVLCGLTVFTDICPVGCELRWKYEKDYERRFSIASANASERPILRTFNFMMERSVALRFPFDESIRRYGHEDTLLGKQLTDAGIPIRFAGIPLLNDDLEPNARFLEKTEEAIQTLADLRESLLEYSPLLGLCLSLRRRHLLPLVGLVLRLFSHPIRHNLLSTRPSLLLFQAYKLHTLIRQL